jgi:DNA-binding NtrC family response regulator
VRQFEAELNDLVRDFVAQLTDLARVAVREMVEQAFASSSRPEVEKRVPVHAPSFGDLVHSLDLGPRPRLRRAVREFQRRFIAERLAEHHGNVTHTAREFGVARQTLQRKLRRLQRG